MPGVSYQISWSSADAPDQLLGRLGLQSETRQTIAPVTFFKGAPFQFTVELLGEWVLRAFAGTAGARF